DRELFSRFRWRFVVVPPLVFLAYFPLYTYHFDLYRLIILCWATWHGLMQLYGFIRIYDAKVGSVSRATANWDWLVCLFGFITPQLFRPDKLADILSHWGAAGGPLAPSGALQAIRWALLGMTAVAVLGFAVNYVIQWRRGPAPNPLKLLMLVSGIGTWWLAMYYIENLIIGLALFDICHDVQYLAIVWLYNCRRVGSNAELGRFMKYVFRRGMVLLYLGLVTAYGAIALVGPLVTDGTVSRIFYGILFTSTILHYYYDGFIWKVRESSNQAGLGLSTIAAGRVQQIVMGRYAHLLKWSPAIVVLGLLFALDFLDPSLTTARKEELDQLYAGSLMQRTELPAAEDERSWLLSHFNQLQHIAAAVPDAHMTQLRSSMMLANFGRHDEAIHRLDRLLETDPHDYEARAAVADIHLRRGSLDLAGRHFLAALDDARTPEERAIVHLKLGEIALYRQDAAGAKSRFQAAQRENPELGALVEALEKRSDRGNSSP
ncbi:MAG: hypothetical protein JNG89_04655, partial [Planctomycetaceae bacterium]|nr:hypothetical protein [Planctomycetaceae bacterium]